jgi:ketosteroid isomerase-like protein
MPCVGGEVDADLAAERIAVSKRCVAALSARDYDTYFACLTSDFVLRTAPGTPGGAIEVGRRELERFFESFYETWEELRYEFVGEPRAVGDCVFTRDRISGRSRATGAVQVAEFFSVATFRDGRAASVDMFLDEDEALKLARG